MAGRGWKKSTHPRKFKDLRTDARGYSRHWYSFTQILPLSSVIHELLADVILEIIKEDPLDNRRNLFRFYNHLTTILRETRDTSILVGASRSLGRLAQISGTVLGDHFVEEQIPFFLEMGSSYVVSSYGVVLALKELALHSSPSFFPHLSNVFNSVLVFLRNSQVYLN